MKFDMKINGTTGRRRTVLRTAVVLAALAGVIPGAPAAGLAGLIDPTQPAYAVVVGTVTASKPTGPELQSTYISASQRRAVISGKSYVVGDKFGGGTIIDIQPYEVVLKHSLRETRLRLLPKLAKETYVVKVPASRRVGEKAGKNDAMDK